MEVRLKILLVINFLDLLCSFNPLFFLIYFINNFFFLSSRRQNKTSTVLNLFVQNRSAQCLYIIYLLILYPKKGTQDSLGFRIPRRGFRILGTGLQSL